MPQNFNLLLILSCLFLTLCCINSVCSSLANPWGHLTHSGCSPTQPSSASTRSFGSRWLFKLSLNTLMSGHIPHSCGPLSHTMSPVRVQRHNSQRKPLLFLNLWLEKARPCSAILKSTPSQLTRQSLPLSSLKRFSQTICKIKQFVRN